MKNIKLGKFKEVDIRKIWKHEEYDFSKWLAEKDNLSKLSDTIGLTLVGVRKEVYVGSYRCDLLAKDEVTDIKVIIENQLGKTDHNHLGKTITYASGLDAKLIIWIMKYAREEHRSAVKWLNENTINDIGFFLIEIHAYKIDDSMPAPKFEIIEKPNDFVKNMRSDHLSSKLTKIQFERFNFWTKFNETVIEKGQPFKTRKATKKYWHIVPIGINGAHIGIVLFDKNDKVVVELYIWNNKELFDDLFEKKQEIENELGQELEWERLDNKKAARAKLSIKGLNFADHSNYLQLMDKIIKKVIMMKKVFKKYI